MKSVTVVGSGIIGLTTARSLQEAGFQVKLIAKEKFAKTLSSKVGAIWFPFEIAPKEKTNSWAAMAFSRYQEEINPENGVTFIPFINAYTSESNNDWVKQLPAGSVQEVEKAKLPDGMEQGLIAEVPLVEPRLYLPHLFEDFLVHGGTFHQAGISSLAELAALDQFVVNCTGLGAKEICQDEELYPIRGQILRCTKLKEQSFADPTKKGALIYLINRSGDTVIGGTDYENDWNEKEDLSDTELILDRLKKSGISQVPEILEVLVGLRPKRSSVRFEFDPDFPNVFHNYGHGGAGFTVAWGCALELAEIIKKEALRT
ncbi:MAG: FAD-dependent oxidoreductase [Algoriphagus sp.]|uniref:FAD-dependent oxidoreductase n=1 Tax=Algoriphagus sp. TaxID=1872435 RepID=UPI002612C683|nr:FAD-dependent oxidoreductase [Algoriphagus sp.]MDG1276454.1 FAD-dependent oxidoreductase [Algoriphagus sp.]